jgi:hypothetical protein
VINIVSALSKEAAERVYATFNSMSNGLDNVHFQVIENRLECPEDDDIYIWRIFSDAGEGKQALISSSASGDQIFSNQYQLYQQNVPNTTQTNRFIYCIAPLNTNEAFKTVCVVLLSQYRMRDKSSMSSDYEYEASLYHITIPQLEQSSDIKDTILQAVNGWNEFREYVKVDSFSAGRLWEMPIQFPGYKTMYLSIHEPIEKPSILNLILQEYFGINVSKKLCVGLILD